MFAWSARGADWSTQRPERARAGRPPPLAQALLVQTALEEAGKRLADELDAAAVTFPNRKFIGAGAPRVQMLGSQSGAGGRSGGAASVSASKGRSAPADRPSSAAAVAAPVSDTDSGKRSAFSFDAKKKAAAANMTAASSKKTNPPAAAALPPFQYSILHQMRPDLGSAWSDSRTAASSVTPAALLARSPQQLPPCALP